MGNENEISKLDKSKALFLPRDIVDPEGGGTYYSLEDEFAASAKNHSYLVYFSIFAFMALLVAGTVLITQYIERQYRNTEISIVDFKDLNLKKLLDSSKNEEQKLALARKELKAYKAELGKKINRIQTDGKARREQIAKGQESAGKKKELTSNQKKQERVALDKLDKEYQAGIAEKQKEIDRLEKAMSANREKIRGEIGKARDLVNNHERLTRIKLEKQRDEYEARLTALRLLYNPVFTSKKVRGHLSGDPPSSGSGPKGLTPYTSRLKTEAAFTQNEFNALRYNYNTQRVLLGRLKQVPYRNSVAPALAKLGAANNAMVTGYERLWTRLLAVTRYKNETIGSYVYALKELARSRGENGYIVDPRNRKKIRLQMNNTLHPRAGDQAQVFRNDDEFIARIEFLGNSGQYARVLELAPGKRPRPMDKVLLKARR